MVCITIYSAFLKAPSESTHYRQRAGGGLFGSKGVAFTYLKYMFLKSQDIAWNSSQGATTSPSYSIWEERNSLKILIVLHNPKEPLLPEYSAF